MAIGATETRITPVVMTEAGVTNTDWGAAVDAQGDGFKNTDRTVVLIKVVKLMKGV